MARYNAIFAGPVEKLKAAVHEATAAVDVLPGSIIALSGADFVLAGAATTGKVFVAQENYLIMKGADDAITAGETILGLELDPTGLYRARLAIGQNVAKGDALTPAANGELTAAGASDMVVATAHETYNNTTGTAQLITIRPATGYLTA